MYRSVSGRSRRPECAHICDTGSESLSISLPVATRGDSLDKARDPSGPVWYCSEQYDTQPCSIREDTTEPALVTPCAGAWSGLFRREVVLRPERAALPQPRATPWVGGERSIRGGLKGRARQAGGAAESGAGGGAVVGEVVGWSHCEGGRRSTSSRQLGRPVRCSWTIVPCRAGSGPQSWLERGSSSLLSWCPRSSIRPSACSTPSRR